MKVFKFIVLVIFSFFLFEVFPRLMLFMNIIFVKERLGRVDGGMMEFSLDRNVNKTGDIWHICIKVIFDLACN